MHFSVLAHALIYLSGNRTHDLRIRSTITLISNYSNPEVVGSIPTEVSVEFRSQSEDLFRTQLKIRKMDDDSKHMAPNMQRGLSKHRKSDVMNN